MEKKRKALSPVIATILLVALVVIIAAIIFLWARSFVKEAIQKNGMPAEQACGEINMEVVFSDNLYITNRGNVPIYSLEIRKTTAGGKENQRIEAVNLRAGAVGTYQVEGNDISELEVVPTILGEGKTSKKEYVCDTAKISASRE